MKNYSIVRIASLHYPMLIKQLYERNKNLQNQPYAEQQKVLFNLAYTYSNSFSFAMNQLGNKAFELIYDVEILQKTWAREHNINYRVDNWQEDILLAQINFLKPDVIYFQDIYALPFETRADLKNKFPFIKLIGIFRGFPGVTKNLFKELSTADVLFVGSKVLEKKCRQVGLNPYLVHHFFDESVIEKTQSKYSDIFIPKYDFTFIGTSGVQCGLDHLPRYVALLELAKRTDISFWLSEQGFGNVQKTNKFKAFARDKIKKCFEFFSSNKLSNLLSLNISDKISSIVSEIIEHREIKKMGLLPPLVPIQTLFSQKCLPTVFGIDMYRILSQSKITFNIHAMQAEGTVDNIRMFQATGMKACLLTDRGSNLKELFEEDKEVVAYSSIDECIEKVNYLLSHKKTRRGIAENGQKRTLKDHNVMNRCQQINEIMLDFLYKKGN
ncbi:MAG: glycosyltransferase family 1 protein [Chlamydiae bacterium]|nr:glycosyltransferase family 1 protein [Chlamydiota bacterium]